MFISPYLVRRAARQFAHLSLIFLFVLSVTNFVQAKENWTRVRSRNFILVGNASEHDIREVALRLEQFRDAFSRLLIGFRFDPPGATRVVVFKSNKAFDPFKPIYQGKPGNVAGYFQSGEDANYITLTTEELADDPYRVIFHEYVHLLLHNTVRSVPPWFDEGLAEYYSTFDTADDGRKVVLGKVIPGHLRLLRTGPWLPLQSLLAVDRRSPYYNERDKTGIFYAESWALVHYLILGNERKRQRELGTFLGLLHEGAKPERAFQSAFQADLQTLEDELKAYVQRNTFPQLAVTLSEKITSNSDITTQPLSEAESRAYLGDLLLHIDRLDQAAVMLEQALALDPQLALAHASLGVVQVKQKRFDSAIEHLRKAAAADPSNYLVHYYLAFALNRRSMDDSLVVSTYKDGVGENIRSELRQAIELKPEFPESYALFAFVNLVQEEDLDESIEMIRHALTLAPGRDDYVFVLAQLYMRKQEFQTARQVLQPMLRENADDTIRQSALTLLNSMQKIEEQLNRLKAVGLSSDSSSEDEPGSTEENSLEPFLRKPKDGEQRVQGFLNRVDCAADTILFSIDAGGQKLTFYANKLERVRFVTYSPAVRGEMSCGMRRPPNPVVVTFRAGRQERVRSDGEVVAVEFVPLDFQLQNP